MVAVEMHGLESQRVVEAFGAQELEETRLKVASQAFSNASGAGRAENQGRSFRP